MSPVSIYGATYATFYNTGGLMAESLVIAGQIELLQGGVPSAIPACAGAIFLLTPGYDLGAPQRSDSAVAAMALDGERPVSRRASNRLIALPVKITAPDRQTLAAAREVLLTAVDHDPWQLTWTRDGSALPMVLDCFRAEPVVMGYELLEEQQLVSRMMIPFQALPYGRSDIQTTVDFQVPIAGKTAPPSPVTIDDFSTGLPTGSWTQSLLGPGAFSAFWRTGSSGTGVAASYSRTGIGPFNLTNLKALTFWAGFGSTEYFLSWGQKVAGKGKVQVKVTLGDGTNTISFHVIRTVRMTNNSYAPFFQKLRIAIPQGTALNYAAVTRYSITITSRGAGDLPYTDVYLDTVEAVPVTRLAAVSPVGGAMYDLAGIVGSARSLMSLQLQQPAGSVALTTKRFTTPGAFSWLCPAGVTEIAKVATVGGAGRAATSTGSTNCGAGGGGAEYASEAGLLVTPGTVYTGQVAAGGGSGSGTGGDSFFTVGGITCRAHGGGNVADGGITGGAGGTGYSRQERLFGDTATFEGGIANWTGAGNCAVAQTAAQAHSGTKSLAVTASATANMTAASCSAANVMTQGEGCDPSQQVFVNHWVRSSGTGRTAYAGAEFYDINGLSLGQLFGSGVADSSAAWTQVTATLTPPGGSGSGRLRRLVKWDVPAAGETHYTDDWSLQEGVQHDGGAGGAGGTTVSGGGGGGSGGPTGSGGTGGSGASGGAGGAAGSGGQPSAAGGAGDPVGALHPGSPGHNPGGGGGGGQNFTAGGHGGIGEVDLWYTQTAPFKTLVVHRPGNEAPDTFTPYVPLGTGSDVPDGTTEYPVPVQQTGLVARFGSTYTIVLVNLSWHTPSAFRTVTVAVNHYEQAGGTVYTQSVSRSIRPDTLASPLCVLGELTIPDRAIPDDNVNAYFTVTVTSGDTADRFQDVLILDTQGSTVMIESPTAYVSYWIDEPASDREVGNILGSQFDRNDAVSVLAYATVSGPPLHVDPLGSAQLLVYAADATALAPSAQMTYWPRWILDRVA